MTDKQSPCKLSSMPKGLLYNLKWVYIADKIRVSDQMPAGRQTSSKMNKESKTVEQNKTENNQSGLTGIAGQVPKTPIKG